MGKSVGEVQVLLEGLEHTTGPHSSWVRKIEHGRSRDWWTFHLSHNEIFLALLRDRVPKKVDGIPTPALYVLWKDQSEED